MRIHQTMEKLAQMKLHGLMEGLREQIESQGFKDMTFEERFGLLVDREYLQRENRRLTRRLQESRLKERAEIEDVDFKTRRGLARGDFLALAGGDWISHRHNLIITGPTGVGKTYLACALAQKACRDGFRIIYFRFGDLLRELQASLADGSYPKLATKIARRDLLVIDDWLRDPIGPEQTRQVLDIFDDRFRLHSTLLTSQVPIPDWYGRFKDPTLADAVLDRIVHNSQRIELKGDSMRKLMSSLT